MKHNYTMNFIRRFKFEILVIFIWGVAVASKILYNGLVFGFDYGTYQPDGKYYTYMALDFLNNNPPKSAQQVVDWYLVHGFKMNTFSIQDLMPSTSIAYPVISHRILYPLLSVPFVAIFGIQGMLVIPSLSLLVLLLSILKLAKKFNKPFIGMAVIIALVNSSTVLRWMIVNCTDSLLVGLFALVPFAIIQLIQKKRFAFLYLTVLIILTSATRFILPVWLSIILVLFFREKLKKECGSLFLVASTASLPALVAQLSTALLPGEAETPIYIKILKLPYVFLKIVTVDVLQFAVLDRIFLLLLTLCLFQAIRTKNQLSSQMFASVFIACYSIGAINGTLGVNFRYEMPVLIFCAWVIIDSFDSRAGSLRLIPPIKRNVIVDKTKE
jgi:hypothetical protein